MRSPLSFLVLSLVPLPLAAQQPCGLPGVTIDVSPPVAAAGELVQVTLTNGSAQTIVLPSSCVFESVHSGAACGGASVFTPLCLAILVPLAPGQSATGEWNQWDNDAAQVAPGSYSFQVRYFDAGFTSQFTCCATLTVECAQASATVRNGSGTNPLTLSSVVPPELGGTWQASLDCSAHASGPAFLITRSLPASGPPTAFGEILVGGPRLLRNTLAHAGSSVTFSTAVPADFALCGLQASSQGVCFGSPGPRLSNALDLVLGVP
jgi:hypothetical protein